jgi:OmpA-OmpF porin, OOP family
MKKFSLSLVIALCVFGAKAQFINDYLVAADKYFARGDYYSASQYYEKYLGQEKAKTGQQAFHPYAVSASSNKKVVVTSTNRQKVIYNLAESYRKLNYHEKALPYYEQAVVFDAKVFPLAKYYYATTLRAMERYDEAAAAFTGFKREYGAEDIYTVSASREMANLAFIQQQLKRTDLGSFTVAKSTGLNAEGGTYAPVWMNDGSLWFTSTRPQGDEKGNTNANRIYTTDYTGGTAGTISLVNIPQPKDMQQGVISATPDGNTLFLTRWTVAKDKKTASIYSSTKQNGQWSEPVLTAALNVAGSNSQQPYVMPDGRYILFSSDRSGGLGGFDLWKAALDENGNISAAENMGGKINTVFDEQAPGYHQASNTLVFSSNGRVGMGGFDFFYSKGTINDLAEPQNFGYPVNSVKDDLYFTSKGSAGNILENVVMSSDREAACCLELFSLSKVKPLKQITGLVIDCKTNQPMAGVKVTILDTINNKTIAEKTTDATGKYSYTLEEFARLKATAGYKGYFNNSVRISVPANADEVNFNNPDICLNPIPEAAIKVENVYYDFNKATLQENSYLSLDQLVQLLNDNPNMMIELGAHTDSKGDDEYNRKLSDARAKSVVDYLISKGIDSTRLVAKGYGETMPVAENTNSDGTDNPEGRQLNRRTEFKVLKN